MINWLVHIKTDRCVPGDFPSPFHHKIKAALVWFAAVLSFCVPVPSVCVIIPHFCMHSETELVEKGETGEKAASPSEGYPRSEDGHGGRSPRYRSPLLPPQQRGAVASLAPKLEHSTGKAAF